MKVRAAFVSTILLSLAAGPAFACGDSLYRVGKGVAYRVYTAPLPGSVLVYGDGEGAELLARELARSGHGVRLVSDDAELQAELRVLHQRQGEYGPARERDDAELQAELGSGAYDVVIAAYKDKSAVVKDSASTNAPTFLPIALTEEEEKQAKGEHERVMVAEKDEIKHYLKAIHRTLKQGG